MKLRLALSAALTAAILVAVPASAAPKTDLKIGMAAQDVGQLDPHRAVSTIDRTVVAWMYNGLVRFVPGTMDPSQIEPDLAEKWESSADKLDWTFHLRRGVKFHGDFGELTADDVVFSLKRASEAKTSAFSADFAAFKTIEATDPYAVHIILARPVPSLLGLLTNYSGGYIVSRKAVEKYGADFTRNPVGTGPFAFVSDTPNQSLELAAFDDYFRGKPKLQRVSYRYIPSDSSRDLAFQNDEIDLVYGKQDQAWINRIRALPNSVVDVFEPGELANLNLNITAKPLDDIRVRQAIAYAVNRPELVKWQGADTARPGQSVIPAGYLGFSNDVGLVNTDVAKAKALLKEAGYPDGVTIKVIHTQLPQMLGSMQVVQAQLRKAGINLDIQVVDHATFHQQIRKDLSPIVYYAAARFPVADIYLTQFFHSASIVGKPTAVTNFSHCDVADNEIDAAKTEADAAKQVALWVEAQKKIVAAVCAVPLAEGLQIWAHRADLDFGYELKASLSLGPVLTEATQFK